KNFEGEDKSAGLRVRRRLQGKTRVSGKPGNFSRKTNPEGNPPATLFVIGHFPFSIDHFRHGAGLQALELRYLRRQRRYTGRPNSTISSPGQVVDVRYRKSTTRTAPAPVI